MFDKKIKFKAKISYTMGENHPDRKYISDFSTSKIFTFEDVYIFDYGIYSIDELKAYDFDNDFEGGDIKSDIFNNAITTDICIS